MRNIYGEYDKDNQDYLNVAVGCVSHTYCSAANMNKRW